MHKKTTYKKTLFISLIFIVVIISGCSGVPSNKSSYNKKYYQGYDSLELTFLPDSPPLNFYYDPDAINEIPVVVKVQNKGSSDAYGVLYIHGYDANIIEVAGGATPNGDNVFFNTGNGGLSISFGNIYIGLPGRGGLSIGFKDQKTGKTYGTNIYTRDGKFMGLDVMIRTDSQRIGTRLAEPAFRMMDSIFGWNAPIILQGDTPEMPGGDTEVYEFPSYISYLPESLERFKQTIMVSACFTYVTRATAVLCIDPRPNSNSAKICRAKDVSLSGGQGAPIAVTRIQQQSSSEKVVLTIDIKHHKKNALDEVYAVEGLFEKCNPHSINIVKPTDKNVVDILYVALSGIDITDTCSGNGRIRLDQSGNGQFTCKAPIGIYSGAAYEAPLTVELGYGYSKNIYKDIWIKRI